MLRDVTDTDRDAVLRWRNHPQVRRASLTTQEIGAEEHRAWWNAVGTDPSRRLLIYCRASGAGVDRRATGAGVRGALAPGVVAAGAVMFADIDPAEGSATWGFYLDVVGLDQRGELLAGWVDLEREAIAYAFEELGLTVLGGQTLCWNTPVLRLHRRFGFAQTKTYPVAVDGVMQDVVWTELTAAEYWRERHVEGVRTGRVAG